VPTFPGAASADRLVASEEAPLSVSPLANPVAATDARALEDQELVPAGALGWLFATVAAPVAGQQICEARPVVLEQREGRWPTPSHGALPSERFGVSSRLRPAKGASSAGCGKLVSGLARETPWVPQFSLQIATKRRADERTLEPLT
jgi:hypothetical protein